MLKSKHEIEVFEGRRGGFYWRARFTGKGPLTNKIIADGSEPYSTRSNARRAARRIGRALAFAPVVNVEVDHA
jgi:hypothetical protein